MQLCFSIRHVRPCKGRLPPAGMCNRIKITLADVEARLGGESDVRRVFALADETKYSGRSIETGELKRWQQIVLRQLSEGRGVSMARTGSRAVGGLPDCARPVRWRRSRRNRRRRWSPRPATRHPLYTIRRTPTLAPASQGLAVLNYERALLLAPTDTDIRANLAFVRTSLSLPAESESWFGRAHQGCQSRYPGVDGACWVAGRRRQLVGEPPVRESTIRAS
jgi:hypothetical protein